MRSERPANLHPPRSVSSTEGILTGAMVATLESRDEAIQETIVAIQIRIAATPEALPIADMGIPAVTVATCESLPETIADIDNKHAFAMG